MENIVEDPKGVERDGHEFDDCYWEIPPYDPGDYEDYLWQDGYKPWIYGV